MRLPMKSPAGIETTHQRPRARAMYVASIRSLTEAVTLWAADDVRPGGE
jgi:hypothetical protein